MTDPQAHRLSLDDPRWTAFVDERPDVLPFHHPAWGAMVADCYGFNAAALALTDEEGSVCAGIPFVEVRSPLRGRRWVALPFTDVCPPLTAGGVSERLLVTALDAAREAAGVSSFELRGAADGATPGPTAAIGHTLELESDADAVFARFHPSQVQRNIRRAQREGVTIRVAERPEGLLKDFYGLHLETRRRLGVPIQPRRFFELLWDRILEPGLGFVLVAEAAGRPVASAVFLGWKGSMIYKFGASDADAWKLRPNHLLMWHAIRSACEGGYRSFHFGRTDLESEGLAAFKRSWGSDERELRYSYLGAVPEPGSGRAGRLVAAVIRRSPRWVGRAAGELLYRYVA